MTTRFYIYLILLTITLLIGVVRLKKCTAPFKFLTLLIFYTLLSEILTRVFAVTIKNSSPVYQIFIPVQFFFVTMIYGLFFNKKYEFFFSWSPVFFLILCIINTLFFQKITAIPSNVILISNLAFVLYSLLFFRVMLNSAINQNIFKQSIFWFNSAVLILFTVSFLYWSFFNYFIRHKIKTGSIATFIYYINIIYYIMLCITIMLNRKEIKYTPDG